MEINISTRRDKSKYSGQLAEKAQEVDKPNKNINTVYQITKIAKTVRGDYGPNRDFGIKSENGSPITEVTAKLEGLKEHFERNKTRV
jgi:hypothetical protein